MSFLNPLLLLALPLLPALWWLLRAMPPAARRQIFPPLEMLRGLVSPETTPERTPWWLLLLRLAAALLLILGLAHPLYDPARSSIPAGGTLLLAVDDGWAAARHWPRSMEEAMSAVERAEREGRTVLLALTAPGRDGLIPDPLPLSAPAARETLRALAPKPWPGERGKAAEKLLALPGDAASSSLWLSDGIEDGGEALAKALARFGPSEIFMPRPEELARFITAGDNGALTVGRAGRRGNQAAVLRALDPKGHVLGRERIIIADGAASAAIRIDLPAEAAARVERWDIEGEAGAAAVYLRDETAGRRRVGLVAANPAEDRRPFTGSLYYVEKAFGPKAELAFGPLEELLGGGTALVVLGDGAAPDAETARRIEDWLRRGGILLRFAGPRMQAVNDGLLPVRLRGGGRMLGGALAWDRPMRLAPFPEHSPLNGLAIPGEVRVNSQALAEPEPGLAAKSWASLEDGTPLITAERRGRGHLILVHTSANGEWSNLALSGLFPEILDRLAGLGRSEGEGGTALPRELPPYRLLDGFGRLTGGDSALPISREALAGNRSGPAHPPGLYGPEGARRALNLGPSLGSPEPLPENLPGLRVRQQAEDDKAADLRPPLLFLAFLLLLADWGAAMILRGAVLPLMLLCLLASPAATLAQEAWPARLLYIPTGDAAADELTERGLSGLGEIVRRRTNAELGEPRAANLERDPLVLAPFVYWAPTPSQAPLSPAARRRLGEYMKRGGMLVVDLAGNGGELLTRLTEGMNLPPLVPVPADHPLGRSFYLLGDFPGRRAGGQLWVEPTDPARNDGVASLIVGGGDWAAAWARGPRGAPALAIPQGGEAQRERAYRFGVNLMLYALTGNYKTDQVHLQAIMERLKR